MKVKHFTDSDLDGIGCYIVTNQRKDITQHDVEFCNPRSINVKVQEFIDSKGYENYDRVLITDLSINYNIANVLNDLMQTKASCPWKLLDHHETALVLNEFIWCHVITHCGNKLCSATALTYDSCHNLLKKPVVTKEFMELVNSYDTFNWVEENKIEAKHFNDLFGIYGRDRFITHITEAIDLGESLLFMGPSEKLVIEIEQERIERHIKNKEKQLKMLTTRNYNVGVVFNEKYVSEVGKTLCDNHPEIDFMVMLDLGYCTAGLRTIREDIDLSEIAKRCGGGGHKKAAGFPVEVLSEIYDVLGEL